MFAYHLPGCMMDAIMRRWQAEQEGQKDLTQSSSTMPGGTAAAAAAAAAAAKGAADKGTLSAEQTLEQAATAAAASSAEAAAADFYDSGARENVTQDSPGGKSSNGAPVGSGNGCPFSRCPFGG